MCLCVHLCVAFQTLVSESLLLKIFAKCLLVPAVGLLLKTEGRVCVCFQDVLSA